MDYIKIRLSKDLDKIANELSRTIKDMFQTMNPMFSLSERLWKPPVDIYETKDEVIIIAAISGVKKEDISLEVSNKAVRILGKCDALINDEHARYCLAEIRYGSFERTLFLPAPIDTDIVNAAYKDGFLTIHMAKMKLEQPRKVAIEDI